ncbi:helix-turn-helix domain-containing protein [Streptomyces morookaense]|uniref:Helix-turn-helix transcriptional regulator n=1 Tax=Streptomyces morookaense TaxID=1970 RepID=A0A7Y7B9X6_STRMO|nr:helix-turn-helix transcriptional regulator [Streptomyces morookaense]NVK81743.1 helix-turn-helix transcriptional regulator [Streptomyces morookaense]GHF43838.1 transcriptional regulator [Streptomyces morookaense]
MELQENEDRSTPRTMLGRRLRRLRESAGLSLRALAERIGYPHTYIGRVERGEQLPSVALAEALDVHFDADELFVELLAMAQDTLIADYSREVVAQERKALRIQVFTSSLIPGLLQTEDYARELFLAGMPGKTPDQISAHVTARMNRQCLFEADDPPYYWAIIDEAALKRPTVNKKFMTAQLDRLLRAADSSLITVQILPFRQALHPMLGGSLTLLTLKDGGTVALVESFDSGEAVDAPKKLVELVQRFDVARSMALPEPESLDLIRDYLEEYTDEG